LQLRNFQKLQKLHQLETFTAESEMSVNIKKTKVLVFNKAGRIKNIEIKFKEQNIACVQQYTYIGVVFAASGSFAAAKKRCMQFFNY
jgi:nitrite reductase/ring-hydroxylating ferredoxin subunit